MEKSEENRRMIDQLRIYEIFEEEQGRPDCLTD